MRCILAISACLSILVSSCSSSSDDDSEALQEARNTILGSWLYAYTEYDCDFSMNFVDGKTFTESSLDENQSGEYTVSEPIEGLIVLNLDIKEDNGLADCEGSTNKDLEPFTTDLEFPDEDTMLWINPSPEEGYVLEFGRVTSSD